MTAHWIDNRPVAAGGDRIAVINPATEEVIDTIPSGSAEAAAEAAAAARRAFPAWSALSPLDRRKAILPALDKLTALRDDVARLLTQEMGKPLAQATTEVNAAIDVSRQFCELALHLRAGSQMSAATDLNFQQRVPRGVTACILPWNFPVVVGMENVVPSLLVGNTVVWKPSEKTPLTSRLIAERIFDHLPPGVLNVALGDGRGIGEHLVASPDVDVIVFIGSERTGKRIGEVAVGGLKKVILELGGKDPFIVDETVDIAVAAKLAAEATYYNSGQICTSTERLFVARKVFEPFVEALVAESKALKLGNGLDADVQMGPLVDHLQLDIVAGHVEDAAKRGASILCGGARTGGKGYFYPATVLVGTPLDSRVIVEETFGPVAPCIPFDDFDEAISLANSARYGLAAIVCTTSAPRAIKAIQTLKAGMIKINTMRGKAVGGSSEPFGASGLGHGYGVEFLYELTKQKSVVWRGEPR
jgi:acyl-CoA reductase-like NAD-dependent aldehyde dehydrogenase